jgi:biotin carboxyl carrier protein
MKTYTVRLNEKDYRLTIVPLQENLFEVTIDGESRRVDVRSCASDALSILVDHRSRELTYAFDNGKLSLRLGNRDYEMDVRDERRRRQGGDGHHAAGPEVVKAAMPGKIVAVHVSPGDTVKPKAGLVVMEAMKMENEIACRKGGRVSAVHVRPGDTVEKGALLVEFEAEAQ